VTQAQAEGRRIAKIARDRTRSRVIGKAKPLTTKDTRSTLRVAQSLRAGCGTQRKTDESHVWDKLSVTWRVHLTNLGWPGMDREGHP